MEKAWTEIFALAASPFVWALIRRIAEVVNEKTRVRSEIEEAFHGHRRLQVNDRETLGELELVRAEIRDRAGTRDCRVKLFVSELKLALARLKVRNLQSEYERSPEDCEQDMRDMSIYSVLGGFEDEQ